MTYYTKDFEKEARAIVKQWCHDSRQTEPEFIKSWILTNKYMVVDEIMRDGCDWAQIILNNQTTRDVHLIDDSYFVATERVYKGVVSRILFYCFCNDVIDLDHEIFEYIRSLDTEPDTRFQDDVDNRVNDIRRSL